mgnify:CR=1 FL=1
MNDKAAERLGIKELVGEDDGRALNGERLAYGEGGVCGERMVVLVENTTGRLSANFDEVIVERVVGEQLLAGGGDQFGEDVTEGGCGIEIAFGLIADAITG